MAKKTKEKICAAFCELASKSPSEDVSVKKIIATAGINRSTFYYHFRDPQDVMACIMTSFSTGYISYVLQISDLANHKHKNSMKYLESTLYPYIQSQKDTIKIFFYEKYRATFKDCLLSCFNNLTKDYTEVSVWPYGIKVSLSGLALEYLKFSLFQQAFEKLEFWCAQDTDEISQDFFFINKNISGTITLTGETQVQVKG